MPLKCALCNTEEFKTEKQFQEHIKGKKHKKLESIKQSRLDSSERSVFVSNLPKNTFTKHLQDYFDQFGTVKKTILDLEKNAYAILEFENRESVDKVLNHPAPHQINEKTVRVKRREVKEFVAKTGPSTAEKKKEILDKLKDEALAVNTLLGKCQTFDEQVDKLIEFLKISDEQLKQREQVCLQLTEIFKKFWSETEFQVRIFGSSASGLACKGSDMDLTLLLNSYLAENRDRQQIMPKLVARGLLKKQDSKDSSNDGGATNSSGSNMADPEHLEENVDLEMDEVKLEENENEAGTESHEQALARKVLKENVAEFFSEKAYDKLITYSVENQVKIIAQVIQRFLMDIKTLRTITNTRCPLVSFFHNKASTNCDLSINNFLANENTNLIKLYMALEPNLIKLIFVIRYWMKQKNLHSSSRFNSYTIIWLIIFYMQKKQIGSLPTVEQLCQLSGKPNMIHGWNVAFETDLNRIKTLQAPASTASYTFNDLLKGFFEFYSQYQFFVSDSPCYISTREAKLHYDIEQSPLSKKHAFINVQDPFDLSHNISANISKNTLIRFVTECKASNDLLSYSAPLKKSETKCWGLILLMTRKALPLTLPGSSVTKMPLNSPASLSTDKHLLSPPDAGQNDEEAKAKQAVEFVMHLFKHCLLFEQVHDEQLLQKKRLKRLKVLSQICDKVDTMELNSSPKRIRTSENMSSDPSKPSNTYACVIDNNNNKNNEEDSDEEKPAESSSKPIAVYQMVVHSNTWQGRRSIKRDMKKRAGDSAAGMEFEREISQMLLQKQGQEAEQKSIHFAVTFSLNKTKAEASKGDFSYLKIKFDLLDDYEKPEDLMNFTTFVHFLDIFISNCQEKYFQGWSQSQVVC